MDRGPCLETALRVYLSACRRLRTERAAEQLLDLLVGVTDPEIRLRRFGEHLRARPVDETAWTFAYLQERVAARDDRAQRVGVGWLDTSRLDRVLPPEHVRAAVALLRKRGHTSADLFGDEPSHAGSAGDDVLPRPKEAVGYRMAMARRAVAGVLERLLFDPDARVVRILLGNPRLTEAEVVRLAASRRAAPDALEAIAQDHGWIARYPVKVALANNPVTPTRIVLGLLPYLLRQDLRALSVSTARDAVREQVRTLLARRSG